MSFEQEKQIYDQQGFVVIPQLLGKKDFTELRENLERYICDIVPKLTDEFAFYEDRSRPETLKQLQKMDCAPYFRDYFKHPKWVALAEALTGESTNADQPQWFNKPPNTNHITPPHQDNYYFCLVPSNVVTIWMALDEVDAENGCLRYVSGSHKNGFREHAKSKVLGFSQGITDYSPDDFACEVAVRLQPGDVVAHHGMTIHRADANMSDIRHRRSFAMVYTGISCQRDEAAYKNYLFSAREQHKEKGLKV